MSINIWILSASLTIKQENLSKAYLALKNDDQLSAWFSFGKLKEESIAEVLNICGIEPSYNIQGDLVEISLLGPTINYHEMIFQIIAPYVEDQSEVIIGIETGENWDYADIYKYNKQSLINTGKKATYKNNKLVLKKIPANHLPTSQGEQQLIFDNVKNLSNQAYNLSQVDPKESNKLFKEALRTASKLSGPADWESFYCSLEEIFYYLFLSEHFIDAKKVYESFLNSDIGDSCIKSVLWKFKTVKELLDKNKILIPNKINEYFQIQIDNYGFSEPIKWTGDE